MSYCWPKVSLRWLFVLLATALMAVVWAGPYADLDARLAGKSDQEAVHALESLGNLDQDGQTALDDGPKAARAYIALRATLEGAPPNLPKNIEVSAGDNRTASSWLAKALDRLKFHWPEEKPREAGPGINLFGPWVTVVVWTLLIGLLLFALYLLLRNVKWPSSVRRRVSLAPDEPLRSADAWREEADQLIAEGRFRDAVRSLYVAGLMRLDEGRVARFDKNQTNWEHLRRIEASPRRPEGLEMRAATGLFDRCWYGWLPTTATDATEMRAWYDQVVAALQRAANPAEAAA